MKSLASINSISYEIIVTLLTAVKTEILLGDAVQFGSVMVKGMVKLYALAAKAGDYAVQLGDQITQPTEAMILHHFLWILVVGIILGGIRVLIFFGDKRICHFFIRRQADKITALVCLMDLVTTVFGAEKIKAVIPVNLVLLFMLVYAGYSALRAFFQLGEVVKKFFNDPGHMSKIVLSYTIDWRRLQWHMQLICSVERVAVQKD